MVFIGLSAINLNQIKIVYSSAVDKTSAETDGNYTVAGIAVANTDTVLLADGKTVILTLSAAQAQGSSLGVSIAGLTIQNAALSATVPAFYTTVTFNDTTAPTLVSVVPTANKILTLNFSEPVTGLVASDFKVDGNVLGVYGGAACVAQGANTAGLGVYPANQQWTLTFNAALTAGSHTLSYTGVPTARYDAANFPLTAASVSFTIESVTGAPTATVSAATSAVANGSVTVTFNRVMDTTTLVAGNFWLDTTGTVASAATVSLDKKSVTLTFIGGVTAGAHVLLMDVDVLDAYGNAVTTLTTPVRVAFTASADTTAMSATSAVATSETVVGILFNEIVDTITCNNSANYVVKNSAGVQVAPITGVRTITPAVVAGPTGINNKVNLTFSSKLPGGSYTVTMSNLKDTAGNIMPTASLSFAVTDLTAPAFYDKDSANGGTQAAVFNNITHQVEVFFNEPVQVSGAYSAIDKANWTYKSLALPSYVTLVAGANNQSVIFTFATTDVLAAADTFTLVVGKDAAGNLAQNIATTSVAISSVDAPYVVFGSIKAYAGTAANDYVTFDVSDYLGTFAAADFTVGGNAPTTGTLSGKTATLYFANGTLGVGTGLVLAKAGVVSANANGAVLTLTNPDATVATAVTDKIAPTMTSILKVGNTIEVTFNEALNMSYVGNFVSDFVVDNNGATITPLTTTQKAGSSTTVVLNFAPTVTIAGAGSVVKVYPAATIVNVKDAANNLWVPSTTETLGISADLTAPTVTSVVIGGTADDAVTAGDTITITFSEATNAPVLTQASFAGTGAPNYGTAGATFVWSAGGTVLTITIGTAGVDLVATDTVAFAAAGTVTDAAGNSFGTGNIYTVPVLAGSAW